MRIERRYTETGKSPYAGIEFRTTTSEIRNPDGSVVFQLKDIEVPADWSQVACDVLAQKYFRKAGIPAAPEARAPKPTCRSGSAATSPTRPRWPASTPAQRMGGETKATQVFDRLAGTWTYWGWKGGYFDGEADARAFYDEMRYMMAGRWARPTRRNGSTPACIGPMASTAPPRATTTSITGPASSSPPNPPMSIPSPMPASSSRSPTIW